MAENCSETYGVILGIANILPREKLAETGVLCTSDNCQLKSVLYAEKGDLAHDNGTLQSGSTTYTCPGEFRKTKRTLHPDEWVCVAKDTPECVPDTSRIA